MRAVIVTNETDANYMTTISCEKSVFTIAGKSGEEFPALPKMEKNEPLILSQFSLKEIKEILDSPNFDRSKALEQQIKLLELRKEHLENLIDLARGIKAVGVK